MIDFTQCEVNKFKAYGGANGNKIHICYGGKGYMLKFPPIPGLNKAMSYTNGCISEYIGCHIYETLGIRVQETLLGTYTDKKGKEKVVVACHDFTEGGKKLMEFAQLKNTCIDSEQNGFGTELSTITAAMEEQELIPQQEIKQFFWDMFIADALQRIYSRIDMERINRIVEETPFLEPIQKEFYQIMLKERKEKILDYSMERLLKQK